MPTSHTDTSVFAGDEQRHASDNRPTIGGVTVREDDIEPVKAIRTIAMLFRGMALLLLVLMVVQIAAGVTSTVPLSPGVMFADAVRLIIFAGLLWGAGDLAVLWVKSHYDLRATRILVARIAYVMRQAADGGGPADAGGQTTRAP